MTESVGSQDTFAAVLALHFKHYKYYKQSQLVTDHIYESVGSHYD